jgi:hypothetical protein
LEQALHLPLLVVRVQIEVQSVLADSLLRNELLRHVDVRTIWIPQNYPVVRMRFPENIAERLLPEGQHPGKVIAVGITTDPTFMTDPPSTTTARARRSLAGSEGGVE